MDSSRGISKVDFGREKDFVKSLASHFNIHPFGARGSVINYGERPATVVLFNEVQFNERVDRTRAMGTPRRTDRALLHTAQILSRSKPKDRKIVVLLTAGDQAPGAVEHGEAGARLRQLGAQIFVFVIGQKPDDQALLPLVDRPQDIVRVQSFSNLGSQSRPISKMIRDKPGKFYYT